MKILHSPIEIAGQLGLSVAGLCELGQTAHAAFPDHHFQYDIAADFPLGKASTNSWRGRLGRISTAMRLVGGYDVYHFHFGKSLIPESLGYIDARLCRRMGKKVVVEFWGSDVRIPSIEASRNPYFTYSGQENERESRRRVRQWSTITDGHAIVADHSFLPHIAPFFPHVHIVPQRIDTRRLQPSFPAPRSCRPRVVHIPSHMATKGTTHVRAAAEMVKARGLKFEYFEIHGVSHAEALAACGTADIVIDQVMLGSHGIFAIEAMALGKPVICYILPELEPTYPDGFPIINANPESLADVLEEWLQQPEERQRRGQQSREYAERVHDYRSVALKLLDVYQRLP